MKDENNARLSPLVPVYTHLIIIVSGKGNNTFLFDGYFSDNTPLEKREKCARYKTN